MTAATMKDAFEAAEPIDIWPAPRELPGGLLPVAAFDCAMLPSAFRPWVEDICERMQTPHEFVAVPVMIAAGAVIGRKVGIRPMRHDDWQEVPNLWGCIIGRPGVMKSPAVKAALKPISRLVALANEEYQHQLKVYEAGEGEREERAKAHKQQLRAALKGNPGADVSGCGFTAEDEPVCRRYKANDSTYQALGELLRQNPNGLLVHRDELISLLRSLDREENSEARGFYLTGWNGSDSYVFDRIGRGMNLFIPSVNLSLIGSMQPGVLQDYVRSVMRGGAGDDGMLQRFSMTVWPDLSPDWQEHDREPDSEYRRIAFDAFDRLDRMTADDFGTTADPYDKGAPYLRFDDEAQEVFREWRVAHERRIRGRDELHPSLESHLSKFRKLVPALSLIHHLASGKTGSVGVSSVLAALAWGEFLETHAQRIYAAGAVCAVDGAKAILRNLRSGNLESPFTARDVAHKGWTPMGENADRVREACDLLEDYGWLRRIEVTATPKGGRPTTRYHVNPKVRAR
jgi:hypothetical protein